MGMQVPKPFEFRRTDCSTNELRIRVDDLHMTAHLSGGPTTSMLCVFMSARYVSASTPCLALRPSESRRTISHDHETRGCG